MVLCFALWAIYSMYYLRSLRTYVISDLLLVSDRLLLLLTQFAWPEPSLPVLTYNSSY